MIVDYYQKSWKIQVASQVAGRFKSYDLRKLGNFTKIPKMLGNKVKFPDGYPKKNIENCTEKLQRIISKIFHIKKTYFT